MNILKELIGIFLIVLSITNPFEVGAEFQAIFFILGFDFMGFFFKLGIFLIDFFFEISTIGLYLGILIIIEGLFHILDLKGFWSYIVKPAFVFLTIYLNNYGWILGFIAAGIDLLLNFSKKYI
ncbi:MAG: hypothetical protein QXY45_03290 [Candidatus Aenigmatarchaeota archaeon]